MYIVGKERKGIIALAGQFCVFFFSSPFSIFDLTFFGFLSVDGYNGYIAGPSHVVLLTRQYSFREDWAEPQFYSWVLQTTGVGFWQGFRAGRAEVG